ncbi:ABC transporter permease subunit [Roseobacter sp. HKCCD9010]|nr:ABC transporter permease subunit [Rhodobacterales bacterium HKCCD4356]NNV11590.1 ABC transporter permease subunit [Roseobacter sp. HKCCD7357]NNV15774.1 ABC transporter permease subunit [Roseobacter sp. HKCCD8768]NNV25234.1 ABC transporter permease subunit [Roseobacter sp. HKCCD8192]NNV29491.1 ABC transporter permease subunit [Roseobacter sp. HKCCD9061]NNV33764.1 ABC transporter permease subunit [Roseobacter sp. HKCCD9073]NNV38014.1 ABC transporter permease subunit [Roseobacter sp. HKCCD905
MTGIMRNPLIGPVVAALVVFVGLMTDQGLGLILAVWLLAWGMNIWLSADGRGAVGRFLVPVLFGVTLLVLWEMAVRLYEISPVILPAPSAIWVRLISSTDVLWADFIQTIVKGAMSGYVMGCAAAFAVALAVDRSNFLQRGLLPVGNFIAALPIVGTAPILVMWYGFGWQSKAAVVVVMVFFPMLVNTVQGLKASEVMQRDLMRTYAASYWQTLFKLRLPAAMPFIFNGLKICTTLALIGAIVAEFFGSPTVGMGFRIKIEVGRLAMDMVWSSITVAALAGTGFYGLMALAEKRLTFWHPSQR